MVDTGTFLILMAWAFFMGSCAGWIIGDATGYERGVQTKKILKDLNDDLGIWNIEGDWK